MPPVDVVLHRYDWLGTRGEVELRSGKPNYVSGFIPTMQHYKPDEVDNLVAQSFVKPE